MNVRRRLIASNIDFCLRCVCATAASGTASAADASRGSTAAPPMGGAVPTTTASNTVNPTSMPNPMGAGSTDPILQMMMGGMY